MCALADNICCWATKWRGHRIYVRTIDKPLAQMIIMAWKTITFIFKNFHSLDFMDAIIVAE